MAISLSLLVLGALCHAPGASAQQGGQQDREKLLRDLTALIPDDSAMDEMWRFFQEHPLSP
jgi:hypothetical protein